MVSDRYYKHTQHFPLSVTYPVIWEVRRILWLQNFDIFSMVWQIHEVKRVVTKL